MASSSFDSDHLKSDELGESDPSDGVFKSTELTQKLITLLKTRESARYVIQSTQDNPSPNPVPQLQSKLCKAIERVIGTAQQADLVKLDSLHTHLKQLKAQGKERASTNDKKCYSELLVSFRTLVLGKRAHID